MPRRYAVTLVAPEQVTAGEGGSFPFELYDRRCLAQGDSWFSIGALPPGATSNVLAELKLARSTVVVNCARPGKVLRRMNDITSESSFVNLLAGSVAMQWHAILVSGGGNDLIDAACACPRHPPAKRLLLTAAERPLDPANGDDYVSPAGWATFEGYLGRVFDALVRRRDRGVNRGVPMLFHTYAAAMPRPAGAGFGFGPWLAPSLQRFDVPQAQWLAVSTALTDRLAALLQRLIDRHLQADPAANLHLVDTRSAPLVLAQPTDTGVAGDFHNEIHLTSRGYRKAAAVWQRVLDPILRVDSISVEAQNRSA